MTNINKFFLFLFLIIPINNCAFTDKVSKEPITFEILNSNHSYTAGEEIIFSAANLNGYEQLKYTSLYEWDYGDGCVSKAANPVKIGNGLVFSHFYALPGTYTVTLTIKILENNVSISENIVSQNIKIDGTPLDKIAPIVSINPIFELNFNNSSVAFSAPGGSGVNVEMKENGMTVLPDSNDFINGIISKAVDLSNGKYIQINNLQNVLNGLNQFTISFWIKKKSYDSLESLSESDSSYIFSQKDAASSKFYFGLNGTGSIEAKIPTNMQTAGISALYACRNGYQWQHCAITYDGINLRLYVDGMEYKGSYIDGIETPTSIKDSTAMSGSFELSNEPFYVGVKDNSTTYSVSNRAARFNGYLDEFKIYNQCLSKEQLFIGFELWHADFQARISQYIYVKIPEQITSISGNKIQAFISDNASYSKNLSINNRNDVLTLIDKSGYTNLLSTEKILLNNYLLPSLPEPGKYTLTVRILNASNTIIAEKKESFVKPYAGSPLAGIDENNTIIIGNNINKGDAFFPVTCWGQNDLASWEPDKSLKNWTSNALDPSYGFNDPGQKWEFPVVNTGFCYIFHPENSSAEEYGVYLDDAYNNGAKAIGPTNWRGQLNYPFGQNADIYNMIDYINKNKNKPAMLMWSWKDEPDLAGIGPETLRAWTKISHMYDPQHPVAATFRGASFVPDSSFNMHYVRSYMAPYNAVQFGKITEPLNGIFAVDVMGYDYYPFDWTAPYKFDASMITTTSALDNSILWSRGMIPNYNFIETTDINENTDTPFYPSPDQLKMLSWLHVVHGMKQISWFPYFKSTPDSNFRFMGQFVADVANFKNILAAPDSTKVISVSIDRTGIAFWSTGTSYSSGSLIQNNGVVYVCRKNHIAETSNQPADESTVMFWKSFWKVERRVDILAKEYNGHLYIFAVRPTELGLTVLTYTPALGNPFPVINSIGTTKSVNITINGLSGNTYTVYNESRNGTITSSGILNDSFEPNDVHIYDVTL